VEVKTEADDVTEYSLDDRPITGVFNLYNVLEMCINFSQRHMYSIDVLNFFIQYCIF